MSSINPRANGFEKLTVFRVPPTYRLAGLKRLQAATVPRAIEVTTSGFSLAGTGSGRFREEWDQVSGVAIITGGRVIPTLSVMTVYRRDQNGSWLFGSVKGKAMVRLLQNVGFLAHTKPSRPDTTLLTKGPADWSVLN